MVYRELEDLRNSFTQLQIEKENLDTELDKSKTRENQFRNTVDKLKSEIELISIQLRE